MTINIEILQTQDLPELYQMLKESDFPSLPDENTTSKKLQEDNTLAYIGKDSSSGKIVLFLCFFLKDEKLYFDIACSGDFKGKWATKKTVKFIFKTAFNTLGVSEMFVESLTNTAKKMPQKLNFEHIRDNLYKIKRTSSSILKYLK